MTSEIEINIGSQSSTTEKSDTDHEYAPAPIVDGARLGPNVISRLLVTSDSGYTYLANDGRTVVQEFFPQQFAVRDVDGISLLLCDSKFNHDYEQGLTEFLLLARVLSQLDHPGRVARYEENDGAAWYSVELPVKASLADLLATGQRLPEENLKTIFQSAVTYLEAAHHVGLLHLELTPERILLAEEDKLLICGFSTDKLHYPPEDLTASHDYRAPELASFRGHLGKSTDYYSLGAILYQGACRVNPPDALTRLDAVDKQTPDPLTSAKILGKGFFSGPTLSLIESLLMLKPGDRPQNADTLTDNLVDTGGLSDAINTEVEQMGAVGDLPVIPPPASPPSAGIPTPVSKSDSTPKDETVAKRFRGASAIAVSALDKTRSVLLSSNSEKKKVNKPSPQSKSRSAKTKDTRKEPIFNSSQTVIKEELDLPDLGSKSPRSSEIVNDLEVARRTLAGNTSSQKSSKAPFSLDQFLSAAFFFLNTQVSRLENSFSKAKDQFHSKFKNPIKGSSLRLALTITIILIVLTGVYIVVTPPRPAGTNTAPTTIEIIGGNTITPDKPQGLEIAAVDFGSFKTSVTDSEFARNDDLTRVNAYRDAERLSRLSEPHLARAREFLANGALISPPNANAYSEYSAVVRMDPSNKEARLGLDSVLTQIVSEVDGLIVQFDFASASEMLSIAQKLAPDNQKLKLKNESIRIAEETRNQQAIAEQARIDADAKKATAERQRKQQIEKLLSKALTAFNDNRLVSPPGENALTLYRATLDLDPSNQRARNGLGNISSIYIRQARDSLSINNLEGTADHLEIALSINPENKAALSLNQQLQRRKYLVTEQQRLQAEARVNINLAQQMSDEQDQLNLYSGIQAYYDGDYAQALQFLKPLADKNDPRAQVRVARMLLEARATGRDKPEAIRMFSAALAPIQLTASQGHAWAQSDLADYYFDGLVIDQDRRTAAVWYQRAAEQGYAPAQTNLGWLYFNGYDGVAPNRAVAIHWFNEAAAQGNQAAANNLRALGESVPQSAGG